MSTGMRVAVVSVSDRVVAGQREDVTGPALAGSVRASGHDVEAPRTAPNDPAALGTLIATLATDHDIVLLAGGVGIAPGDRTPEAVQQACDRMVPGIGEAVRAACRDEIPAASLWRACGGTRGASVIIALPGSPGAAEDAWEVIAPFAMQAVEQVRHHGPGG